MVQAKSGPKKVRWYSDAEYAKMYPEEPAAAGKKVRPWWGPQKDVLGFQKGFIWILQEPDEEAEEWLILNGHANGTRFWGRCVYSQDGPIETPFHIKLIKLYWDDVGDPDGYLKPDDEVYRAVDEARYGKVESHWVGQVGACKVKHEDYKGEKVARIDYFIAAKNATDLPAWEEPHRKEKEGSSASTGEGFMDVSASEVDVPF
jgi:hypothetical protein